MVYCWSFSIHDIHTLSLNFMDIIEATTLFRKQCYLHGCGRYPLLPGFVQDVPGMPCLYAPYVISVSRAVPETKEGALPSLTNLEHNPIRAVTITCYSFYKSSISTRVCPVQSPPHYPRSHAPHGNASRMRRIQFITCPSYSNDGLQRKQGWVSMQRMGTGITGKRPQPRHPSPHENHKSIM